MTKTLSRINKNPNSSYITGVSGITEECFQSTPLKFAGEFIIYFQDGFGASQSDKNTNIIKVKNNHYTLFYVIIRLNS